MSLAFSEILKTGFVKSRAISNQKDEPISSQRVKLLISQIKIVEPWADPEGAGVSGSLLKIHKNIGFLSNTGPEPLKNHKATKPAFNGVGPHGLAREMPFKWRFPDRAMMARF